MWKLLDQRPDAKSERYGDGWVNSERCQGCSFIRCCCAGGGYTYDAEDFPEINPSNASEKIAELLRTGEYIIERRPTYDDTDMCVVEAAPRYELSGYVSPCVHYDVYTGCQKRFEDRPAMCRKFKPGDNNSEGCEIDPTEKADIISSWKPFQNILEQLVDVQDVT